MSREVTFENDEFCIGDALIGIYRICTDLEHSEEETPHSHSYYELHLVLKGEYLYSIFDKTVSVREGEMVLISPDVPHKAVIPGANVEVSVLSISIKKCSEGQGVYGPIIKCFNKHASLAVKQSAVLRDLISRFDIMCQNRSLVGLFKRKELACKIISDVLLSFGLGEQNRSAAEPMDFDILLETLVQNSRMPLYEIADRLGYSQRQISRIIKERYGMTFAQLRRGME